MRTFLPTALLLIALSILPFYTVVAQDHCGSACPVCTGELKLDRGSDNYNSQILRNGSFNWFTIYTPAGHGEEQEKGSTSFSVGLFNRIETGLTLGLESWELRAKVKLLAIPESKFRPALLVGVGNIRPTGTESNGYLMLGKGLTSEFAVPVWSYVGVAKPFDGRDFEPIFGLSVGVVKNGGLMYSYDGQESHLGLAYQPIQSLGLGFMLVDMQHLGLFGSFSGKLPFAKRPSPTK